MNSGIAGLVSNLLNAGDSTFNDPQKLSGKALRMYRKKRKVKDKIAKKSRRINKQNGSTRPSNW